MTDRSHCFPWFRLYHEILDDDKLRLLAFEDRWHYIAILCCKAKGLLDSDDAWPLLQRRLAVRLGVQARELEEIHRRLIEVGLVDEWMQPEAWEKRQRRSDQDPTGADRQRRYREKRVSNASRNGEVTPPEGEGEVERDKEGEKPARVTAHPLPDDWSPPRNVRDQCLAMGLSESQVDWELGKFRDHWAAATKNARKKDWGAAFRNWCRKAVEFQRERGGKQEAEQERWV